VSLLHNTAFLKKNGAEKRPEAQNLNRKAQNDVDFGPFLRLFGSKKSPEALSGTFYCNQNATILQPDAQPA